MRFRLLPLGITFGVVWGLAVFGMALVAMHTAEYGHKFVELVASCYPGYGASVKGALIGGACGLGDGFGCGVILWLALNWSLKKAKE